MAVFRRRKSSRKTGIVKRAKGNLRSAKSNTDSLTQTITFTAPVVLGGKTIASIPDWYYTPENEQDRINLKNNAHLGVVALNIWDLLSRAPNFKAFQRMYDQVRIDYASVTLTVTNSTITTANSTQTYDIYTAWDRTGLDSTCLDYKANSAGDVAAITGVYVTLGEKITDYNHSKSVLNAFQRWRKSLYVYPKSLQEKSQYVNTGQVVEWRKPYNTNDLFYPFLDNNQLTGTGTTISDKKRNAAAQYQTVMNQDNPALFLENGKYPFKPTLLIGAFQSSDAGGVATINNPLTDETKIIMSTDWKVVCTFRGAKGAAAIS